MIRKSLSDVVSEHPFPDYNRWWPMGDQFLQFMSKAIVNTWLKLPQNRQDLGPVQVYVQLYLEVVYRKSADSDLVVHFTDGTWKSPLRSGEFDALSYGFYRSAFEMISSNPSAFPYSLNRARRQFTIDVGRRFYRKLSNHLDLDPPEALTDAKQFKRVRDNIRRLGTFLEEQRYLRDKFAFSFDLDVQQGEQRIQQSVDTFLESLLEDGKAHALYVMGYPAILPSAVYLFQTFGEAQHHSSRTIEELFARAGCVARESEDFDPSGFPPDEVVELWEIQQASAGEIPTAEA